MTKGKIIAGAIISMCVVLIVGGIILNYVGDDEVTDETSVTENEEQPTKRPQAKNGGGNKAVTKRPPQAKTPPPAAGGAGSVSTLPPPSRLTLDYSQSGQVKLRADGNIELRGKNVPFNFGERPSTAQPRSGDRSIIIPGPNAIGTDSTRCKASQVEYRRRADGNIEIVTRGCTRITRWQ